jgi:hypothetical protein
MRPYYLTSSEKKNHLDLHVQRHDGDMPYADNGVLLMTESISVRWWPPLFFPFRQEVSNKRRPFAIFVCHISLETC